MMFSWTVTQIPNYMIISWLGINNNYLALILPACSYGMGLYLMKQFMEQLPTSLMESARLDGASGILEDCDAECKACMADAGHFSVPADVGQYRKHVLT